MQKERFSLRDKIMKILESAVDEINVLLSEPVEFSSTLKLIGSQGKFDSMSVVSFIATVEDLIFDEFGKQILLVNDKAFSKSNSPFYSIETMCNYIMELLEDNK
jgi:hypothetical protein